MKILSWIFFVCIMGAPCQGKENPARLENALLMLFRDELGHTLVGEKPISVKEYGETKGDPDPEFTQHLFQVLKDIFDKSPRYIFKIIPQRQQGLYLIELVHKKALSALISRSVLLQTFITQNYGSEKKLFLALKDPQKNVFDCFLGQSPRKHERAGNHEALGIALGYGRANSRYYVRFITLARYLKKYPLVRLVACRPRSAPSLVVSNLKNVKSNIEKPFAFEKPLLPPKPSPPFKSLEKEWEWICKTSDLFPEEVTPPCPYLFRLPAYKARKGKESGKVKLKFMRARTKVAALFCGKKFSEVIAELERAPPSSAH